MGHRVTYAHDVLSYVLMGRLLRAEATAVQLAADFLILLDQTGVCCSGGIGPQALRSWALCDRQPQIAEDTSGSFSSHHLNFPKLRQSRKSIAFLLSTCRAGLVANWLARGKGPPLLVGLLIQNRPQRVETDA